MIPDWLIRLTTEGITIPVRLVIDEESLSLLEGLAGRVSAGNLAAQSITEPKMPEQEEHEVYNIDETRKIVQVWWESQEKNKKINEDNKNIKRIKNTYVNVPEDQWNIIDKETKFYSEDDELIIKYHNTNIKTTWSDLARISRLDFTNQGIEVFKIVGFSEQKLTLYKRFIDYFNAGKISKLGVLEDISEEPEIEYDLYGNVISCPDCDSTEIRRGEIRKNNNSKSIQFVCKKCGRKFVGRKEPYETQEKDNYIKLTKNVSYLPDGEIFKLRYNSSKIDISVSDIERMSKMGWVELKSELIRLCGTNTNKQVAIRVFISNYLNGNINPEDEQIPEKVNEYINEPEHLEPEQVIENDSTAQPWYDHGASKEEPRIDQGSTMENNTAENSAVLEDHGTTLEDNTPQNCGVQEPEEPTLKEKMQGKRFYPLPGDRNVHFMELDNDELVLCYNAEMFETSWQEVIKLAEYPDTRLNVEVLTLIPNNSEKRIALMAFIRAVQDEVVLPPEHLVKKEPVKVDTRFLTATNPKSIQRVR